MRPAAPWVLAVLLSIGADAPAEGLGPLLPAPKGEQCVEPTQVMRERHWEFLMHQRDDTVYQGIRTPRHSLKNCLECHVRPDEEGRYPRITEEDHFCGVCHVYAGVRIDCFECHADRPQDAYGATTRPKPRTLAELIRARAPER